MRKEWRRWGARLMAGIMIATSVLDASPCGCSGGNTRRGEIYNRDHGI